ncbi:MAG: hypothetical protein LBR27_12145 [Bifidobacteriaceae bacterium]|nr:hypothetical protein [Bifidobacteriaceae bacterium]
MLAAVAAGLGVGFVSAVFPLVNAEAATLAAAAVGTLPVGVGGVCGLAVGQTAGKIVIYELTRAGRESKWLARLTARRPAADPAAVPPSRWSRFKAWVRRWGARGVAAMERGRWPCAGVTLAAAGIGIPPLLVTAVAAGAIRMRRLDFAVVVLVGRLARFLVLAWPVLAARH